jgi:hypothetical protein
MSILFGIDQSLAGRHARPDCDAIRAKQGGRAWLTIVEYWGLGGENQQRVVQAGIAPRRGVAVPIIWLILDA